MKLKKWFIATSVLATLPLAAISCSKEYEKAIDNLNTIINSQEEKLAKNQSEIEDLKKELQAAKKESEAASKLLDQASNISTNLWNSFSANKDVTSKQAYETAKRAFDEMIKQDSIDTSLVDTNGDKVTLKAKEGKYIPVVFMDLDETVLNNFKAQNYYLFNGGFNFEIFEKFVKEAIADEVLGSIEFIKYVWSKGGVVMYNSNRLQATSVEGSRRNLVKLGLDEKLLPDWTFWMDGVDLSHSAPWAKTTKAKSKKEERMNLVNTKEWEIDGSKVKFRTIMRIGDDINDFNDNFTKGNAAENIKKEVKDGDYGKLFGNTKLENKSIYFNPKTKTWEKKDWAESYIFISGNAAYGGWIKQIGFKNSTYSAGEALGKLKEYIWAPAA